MGRSLSLARNRLLPGVVLEAGRSLGRRSFGFGCALRQRRRLRLGSGIERRHGQGRALLGRRRRTRGGGGFGRLGRLGCLDRLGQRRWQGLHVLRLQARDAGVLQEMRNMRQTKTGRQGKDAKRWR